MRTNLLIILLLFLTTALMSHGQDWHKSQIGTGVGNCGPECVAMSVQWATREEISVEEIREIIGWPHSDGSTSWDNLYSALRHYNVNARFQYLYSRERMLELLTYNSMMIVMVGMDMMSNYEDVVGHYIVIYGYVGDVFYSADPLQHPSKVYRIEEIWNALRHKNAIIITR